MRTKTTLKKTVNFLKNCKSIFSFPKKILQNIFSLLFCLITGISFSQSASCNASLVVENNGNVRSTPLDGTYYTMVLTNNSPSTDTYSLTAANVNTSCANTDGTSNTENVRINTAFMDSQKVPVSEITLNAGQSVVFYIHITVPVGTSVEKWSCNQITATSKTCINYTADTVLHTYVINPVND